MLTVGNDEDSQPADLCNSQLLRLSKFIPPSLITEDEACQVYPTFPLLTVALSTRKSRP